MHEHVEQLAFGLAFETSGPWGSIALGRGEEILEVRRLSKPRNHAVEFVSAAAEVCAKHSVEPATIGSVYVSSGPGSFTGLRIGVTVARMLALAGDARLVPVPTLEVIAQNGLRDGQEESEAGNSPLMAGLVSGATPPARVAVILDAKRGKVYAGGFVLSGDCYGALAGPVEADPLSFLREQAGEESDIAVLGEGVAYHKEAVESSGLRVLSESLSWPRAAEVYRLGVIRQREGRSVEPNKLVPVYVRPPEAEEKWRMRQAEGRAG